MANLLNLPISEVQNRIEKEHRNKLVRNIFKSEWPNRDNDFDDIDVDEDEPLEPDTLDYLTLGKMTVKDVLNHDVNLIELISRYARKSPATVKNILKMQHLMKLLIMQSGITATILIHIS
ncbi:MAG: hypothetical protein Q8N96_16110 [Methylovulum sp.]|nr:hypothetical protein [Methylovulum sp.]